MRLKNLTVNNIYSFGEAVSCVFEYIGDSIRTLIIGRNNDEPGADSNGSGKSNILNSIFWILFGEVFQEENVDTIIRLGQSWCSGELTMTDGQSDLVISRGRGTGKRRFLRLTYGGEDKTANTDEQTQAEILKYLQISPKLKPSEYINDFVNTVYFSSDVAKGFMGKKTTSKERFQLVERFLSLKRYSFASELAKTKKSEIKVKADELSSVILSKETWLGNNVDHVVIGELNVVKAQVINIQNQMLDISARIISSNGQRLARETLNQKKLTLQSVRQAFDARFTALETELATNTQQQAQENLALTAYNQLESDARLKAANAQQAQFELTRLQTQVTAINASLLANNTTVATSDMEIRGIRDQLSNHLKCPACQASLMYHDKKLQHINADDLSVKLAKLEQARGQITTVIQGLGNDLLVLQSQIKTHTAVVADATAAATQLTRIRNAGSISASITNLKTRAEQITQEFQAVSEQAKAQIVPLKNEVTKLENELLAANEPEFDVEQAENQLKQLKTQETEVNKQIGQYEEQLRVIAQVKTEISELKIQLAEEQRQAEMYGFWEVGFRQLKLDIIDQFLPDFETLVNRYLDQLKVSLRVAFGTQKEKANVSKRDREEGRAFKEEFNVEVFKDGKDPLPYGLMSKGQRGRIGSCVGMALRELTKERGNNLFDFFFMDEIADALDESGLRELVSLLDDLPGQKLVISHNDVLKDLFEHRIVVEIENDVSTIKAA